jgi:hypothetical protein
MLRKNTLNNRFDDYFGTQRLNSWMDDGIRTLFDFTNFLIKILKLTAEKEGFDPTPLYTRLNLLVANFFDSFKVYFDSFVAQQKLLTPNKSNKLPCDSSGVRTQDPLKCRGFQNSKINFLTHKLKV